MRSQELLGYWMLEWSYYRPVILNYAYLTDRSEKQRLSCRSLMVTDGWGRAEAQLRASIAHFSSATYWRKHTWDLGSILLSIPVSSSSFDFLASLPLTLKSKLSAFLKKYIGCTGTEMGIETPLAKKKTCLVFFENLFVPIFSPFFLS